MDISEYKKAIKPNLALEEIDDLAHFASSTYKQLRADNHLSNDDGEHWDIDSIESYGPSGVVTKWEYDWNYGGHDEGTSFIPIDALIGTEAERIEFIKSVIQDDLIGKEKIINTLQLQLKTRKLAEFLEMKKTCEKLKNEFGFE